jgi:protein TonB
VSLILHLLAISLAGYLAERIVKRATPVFVDFMMESVPLTAAAPGPRQPEAAPREKRRQPAAIPTPRPMGEVRRAADQLPMPAQKTEPRSEPTSSTGFSTGKQEPLPLHGGQGTASPAAAAPPSGGETAGTPPVVADKGQGSLEKSKTRYLREHFAYIRDLIMSQLVYPQQARRMRWSGRVTLSFIVHEDGSVGSIRVVESSGFPLLDRSAMDTVRKVAPFPRPPTSAEIVVPVNFKLM